MVRRHYSPDLKSLLAFFLCNSTRLRHINDVMPMIGARFYAEVDELETRTDRIQAEMAKEIDNGRYGAREEEEGGRKK